MPMVGHLVNGKFVPVAQDFDILDAPEATETSSGLMSTTDKKKLDNAYTSQDVATSEEILNKIFNK